jgi:hypothetical protein
VKTLEERLRKTESLLRAAGIRVESTDFGDSNDFFDDDNDGESAMEDDNDPPTRPRLESCGGDAEVSSHTLCFHSASAERAPSSSGVTKQPSESDTLPKLYECARSTIGKGGPPGYKPDKENSLYIGMAATVPISIVRDSFLNHESRTVHTPVNTDQRRS